MRSHSRTPKAVLGLFLGLVLPLAGGCGLFGGGSPDGKDPVDSSMQDIAAYNQAVDTLAKSSAQFMSKQFSYQEAHGNKLYYLDFPGFDPRLHRFDGVSGARIDYAFSIGAGDAFNYRVSENLIVTAHDSGGQVEYDAYAAGMSNQLVGKTTLSKPAGAKWWAYAAFADDVYFVIYDGMLRTTTLRKWTPSMGSSTLDLFTLEMATGQSTLGEFLDFGVDGDMMVFIEGGRIWRCSISGKRASFLQNMTQVLGGDVQFEPDGVAFTSPVGWYFYQSDTKMLLDLGARIRANPYKLNETFKTIHYYDPDSNGFTRWKDYMIYIGGSGVFAYDLTRDTVTPVLLEPRDAELRTEYRYPQATDNGLLFVTGLQSSSGSVGADGPIFRVDLTQVLK